MGNDPAYCERVLQPADERDRFPSGHHAAAVLRSEGRRRRQLRRYGLRDRARDDARVDDQGSQFDAQGNLRNWWSASDLEKFKRGTGLVSSQFDAYTVLDSVHVNGKLTLGENLADLGGLSIAYAALEKALAEKGRPPLIDGFTPEQRFFLAWAQIWRQNITPEAQRVRINTDPHSPGQWRTNGPLSNLPQFAAAFGCKPGDAMVRPDSVRPVIW